MNNKDRIFFWKFFVFFLLLLSFYLFMKNISLRKELKNYNNLKKENKIFNAEGEFKVKKVISGNSFELLNGTKISLFSVDLIDKYTEDAKIMLKKNIDKKTVKLIKGDFIDRDSNGYALRYVFIVNENKLEEDIFVNQILLSKGVAKIILDSSKPQKYDEKLIVAEEYARCKKMNLWKNEFMDVYFGEKKLELEIADERNEKFRGFSFRNKICEDGMIFIYDKESLRNFHMRKMRFSLDIVFLDKDANVVNLYENVKPCNDVNCKKIFSEDTQFVLEFKAGFVANNNIQKGDNFKFDL